MTRPQTETQIIVPFMKFLNVTRLLHPQRVAAIALAVGMIFYGTGFADDVPPDTQEVGNHSIIHTTDGGVTDKEFADYICQKINENGGKVKDVKVMADLCFGGGLLDDLQRVFGPGGACEGIPWVAGSSSAHDEVARGWNDLEVDKYPAVILGSPWTNALLGNSPHIEANDGEGVIPYNSSGNVLTDIQTAGKNDVAGSNRGKKQTSQAVSGNGGENITWKAPDGQTMGHQVVVFGGVIDQKSIKNDLGNASDAFNTLFSGEPHNVQTIKGGTRQDLFDAIGTAAEKLDENTQLVIYIGDHGGTLHDIKEVINDSIGEAQPIQIEEPTTLQAYLSPGLFQGVWGNFFVLEPPNPTLNMEITECNNCSHWMYSWNGYQLDFPSGNPMGWVSLPIPFYKIYPRMNYLEIIPNKGPRSQADGNQPMTHQGVLEMSNLELNSGGISHLELDQRLIPAQSAAFYDTGRNGEGVFVELLDNGEAVAYVFTYSPDGTGQSWMLGFGEQVGFGIVITEMFLPTGPSFGPDFDPDDLVMNPFGSLALAFPSCGTNDFTGVLEITPGEIEGYDELVLSTNYTQLTEIIDCQTSEKSPDSGYSGSWFDPAHNGEGIILEVLKDGTVVVQWFTYDKNGGQMWIQGSGTIENNILTVSNLYTTSGTAYGSGFDPNNITQTPWGTLAMEFTSCGEAILNYNSSAGFGSGTLNMIKLTKLMGIPCEE